MLGSGQPWRVLSHSGMMAPCWRNNAYSSGRGTSATGTPPRAASAPRAPAADDSYIVNPSLHIHLPAFACGDYGRSLR